MNKEAEKHADQKKKFRLTVP
jgi:hypothetical protein